MWHSIAKQITDYLHTPFTIDKRQLLLHVEDSNYYQISDQKQGLSYVVRIAPKSISAKFDVMTRCYAMMADWLASPHILLYGLTADQCFVVLEHFETDDECGLLTNEWCALGKRVARMHRENQQGMFGWEEDSFTYQFIQPNRWQKNWASFFAEQRIGWQLQLHQEKGKYLFNIADITSVIHRLLHHHNPEPCLLHGQLVPNNIFVTSAGIFMPDNACYCGDRELDLAWLTTFSSNYNDFIRGYTEVWPLASGHEKRQIIYALYPLLVRLHHDPSLEARVHHHIALILAI